MIAYFYEKDKLYFGKINLMDYFLVPFSREGRFIKIKTIKNYEQYGYYKDYVYMSINRITFCTEYNKDWDYIKMIEYTEELKKTIDKLNKV